MPLPEPKSTAFGLQRIVLPDISQPREDQPTAELRFVNPDGSTEVWIISKAVMPWDDENFKSAVRLAYLDYGVDSRLANQRASIERLQEDLANGEEALTLSQNALADARQHISHHHDGFAGVFSCGYPSKESAK
jgi:hypothetical protein